MNQLTELLPFN